MKRSLQDFKKFLSYQGLMTIFGNRFHLAIQAWCRRRHGIKTWILKCRLSPLLRSSAENVMQFTASAFLRVCVIDEKPRIYIFFDIDVVKCLMEAAWLRRTRALLFQMNDIPALVEWKWDFSFARMDNCEALGYFARRETYVKHRICSMQV